MDKQANTEIVRGLQQGDRDAWSRLYELYAEQLWRNVARLMQGDPASVADVVQETFLAAARSAGGFDPGRGSLWVWLWTIAQRQIALHYRRQKPRHALVRAQQWWTSLDGQKREWVRCRERPPTEVLESRELATLVGCALAALPAEYQVLLIAKYIDGDSVKQIAEKVRRSPMAVRSKLARARKAFRRTFKRLTGTAPNVREVTS
ncbi:MAG: RNA polymerase sigma factor [Phycisphaerales bacterium]|nr:MAG: RNA polymerase sigma factor [Phycisphaerales bacterium]